METNDIPKHEISDWAPIDNKHDLAVLGKLIEEAGELVSAAARCLIQGIDEKQPVTGKVNKEWLEDEIADCMALQITAISRLGLNLVRILERRDRKMEYKKPWFDALANPIPGWLAEWDEQKPASAISQDILAGARAMYGASAPEPTPELSDIKLFVPLRHPHDSIPYYCGYCGKGYSDFMACFATSCKLESFEAAKARAEIAPSARHAGRDRDG